MKLDVDSYCFVCGPENPEGLHVRFEAGEGRATAAYEPRDAHQGYAGVLHGGILATLLDEAMVYAAVSLGRWTATAEMTVRYLKPAPTGQALSVTAEVTGHQRRLVYCRAEVHGPDATVLATATGKLMQGRELTAAERQEKGFPP